MAIRPRTVWTIVNRNEYDVDGRQIELAPEEGVHYFDLYHGVELKAAKNQAGRSVLSFQIEAHSYAYFWPRVRPRIPAFRN